MSCEQCEIYRLKIRNMANDLERYQMESYLMAEKLRKIYEILKIDEPPYLAVRDVIQEEQKHYTGEKK